MDAIEILKHDHRMVEQLFRDYGAVGGPPGATGQRRGVVEVMIRELSKHAALEEVLFYPFAERLLGDGDKTIEQQLAEHMVIKRRLLDLDQLSGGDEREAALMEQLRTAVDQHIESEENDLMQRVREACDEQSLAELGAEIDKGKATAPTRPHPLAPDKPPVLTAAAPIVAIYDRLRDRLQGRPKT